MMMIISPPYQPMNPVHTDSRAMCLRNTIFAQRIFISVWQLKVIKL